ncbi:CaiB/BaiF CoA transferase family protein [Rufibacter radiotolerans]|uniref:CaiB/BaiF CoA transferase family protein n=1 Tax=Rufibacter radiotolerans TaxID=1379910 RepID=UPI0006647A8B|nr:CaiB/BaiF CoA-transferase family protein [Rufibacter radiotolerans]
MASGKGLFHDLVVVELASVLAGPSVGQFFAELGARVIKIENAKTNGDVTRRWKLPSEAKETMVSAYFSAANWGKESVCLDLSDSSMKKAVYQIIRQADVVLASFKPGDAEKLGLDFASLVKVNPSLVYGSITGYGKEVARAGYDAVLQAEAGFMYLNGEKGGAPLKMPVALIDLLAAHQLKEGLLAALYLKEKTGKGQLVEVSLLRAAIASLANQGTNYLVAGVAPERMGSEHPNIVPYGTVFQTADGKELVLAIGDDRQFSALCTILGQPELASQDSFKTNSARVANREALTQKLKELVAQQNRDPFLHHLNRQNVPAGAIHTVPEALAQEGAGPQLLQGKNGQAAGIRQIAFVLEGEGEASLTPPPVLGAHSWQVLQELGKVSEQQLEVLERKGTVKGRQAI